MLFRSPFTSELSAERSYVLTCPDGLESRPKIRAFRDWLECEVAAAMIRALQGSRVSIKGCGLASCWSFARSEIVMVCPRTTMPCSVNC